jgi:hypothetical protein
MMNVTKVNIPAILFAVFAVLNGCKDNSDEKVSAFVGNFTINSAKLAEPLTLTTNEYGAFSVPVDYNITTQIQSSLLSAVSCESADNALVELRKDNSIYMSCAGQNSFNAGTWEEVNDTTLILNMNSTAIPTSPSGFALTVEGIKKTSTGMKGKTSVPLPKVMIAVMVAPLTLVAETPAVIPVVFTIDFVKK